MGELRVQHGEDAVLPFAAALDKMVFLPRNVKAPM